MNHEQMTKLLPVAQNYCYICYHRFKKGEPQVHIDNCPFYIELGGIKYPMPLYSHVNCFVYKVVRRKNTTIPEHIFKTMVRDWLKIAIITEKQMIKRINQYPTTTLKKLKKMYAQFR